MNNINDLNIKIFDETIYNKFENKCDIDIFDNIYIFIINFISKYNKFFIILFLLIIYSLIRYTYKNNNINNNDNIKNNKNIYK